MFASHTQAANIPKCSGKECENGWNQVQSNEDVAFFFFFF